MNRKPQDKKLLFTDIILESRVSKKIMFGLTSNKNSRLKNCNHKLSLRNLPQIAVIPRIEDIEDAIA